MPHARLPPRRPPSLTCTRAWLQTVGNLGDGGSQERGPDSRCLVCGSAPAPLKYARPCCMRTFDPMRVWHMPRCPRAPRATFATTGLLDSPQRSVPRRAPQHAAKMPVHILVRVALVRAPLLSSASVCCLAPCCMHRTAWVAHYPGPPCPCTQRPCLPEQSREQNDQPTLCHSSTRHTTASIHAQRGSPKS